MVEVFVGIGSNLGNRRENIKKAIGYLEEDSRIVIEKISSVIETEPLGGPPQGKYLNGVIKIKTDYSPKELLGVLQRIEKRMGRKREVRFGPRVIDLDILLYGEEIIDDPELKIPHPRMFEREFVLGPLFELEPGIEKVLKKITEKLRR
ncbi:MAG: 2-amino-4-hydroxy-6-hydroxymethyldihydropteridine diphosphokinase [Candidatus Omnitrophota bacterium]|nr:MAG: 2-amino-4-hydroxy-6-hydroxymethyldihydropteridine diphosphokinase [Candidatus Omnitrophota bacterium]RKY37263.1 MAG: 2-amino-4-hydroxy-6-hydroxymethyldihydropteridine diphosphokinase [Candidatus Omnitrophota bacterium]RKY46294.1 MAG: 2-amino-4-hydroxy-6-hydroxymethyldihydropteridine diphosphokinase [Candidatus Omnitrophota bacterium]HDN86572.1 2-amino-4-hydroxy-6-hydroxymethyldihydropteridine diphosphokinase [Candidatus Omnitrophota bacterium]